MNSITSDNLLFWLQKAYGPSLEFHSFREVLNDIEGFESLVDDILEIVPVFTNTDWSKTLDWFDKQGYHATIQHMPFKRMFPYSWTIHTKHHDVVAGVCTSSHGGWSEVASGKLNIPYNFMSRQQCRQHLYITMLLLTRLAVKGTTEGGTV